MKYLLFNTEQEALNRNSQEAQGRGCGSTTLYWWYMRPSKAGKSVLCIPENDYGTLTATEINALKDSVVWPDVPNL